MSLVEKKKVTKRVMVSDGGTIVMRIRKGMDTVLAGVPQKMTNKEFTSLMMCIIDSVQVYDAKTHELIRPYDKEYVVEGDL